MIEELLKKRRFRKNEGVSSSSSLKTPSIPTCASSPTSMYEDLTLSNLEGVATYRKKEEQYAWESPG